MSDVVDIVGDWDMLALRVDGTVWSWGNFITANYLGSRPRQVPTGGVISIAAGQNNAYAVRTDGTVWAWGNAPGLGGASGQDTTTPIQVPGLTGISTVVAHTVAVLALGTDGSVWAWGYGSTEQPVSAIATTMPVGRTGR